MPPAQTITIPSWVTNLVALLVLVVPGVFWLAQVDNTASAAETRSLANEADIEVVRTRLVIEEKTMVRYEERWRALLEITEKLHKRMDILVTTLGNIEQALADK